MSSNPDHDFVDYVTDEGRHEDGTLFLPSPENRGDPWTRLVLGILAGLAGAALVTVSPWLAGAMVAGGYALAALNLRGGNQLASALCFGFAMTALLGAVLAIGYIAAPGTVQPIVFKAGRAPLIIAVLALLPWALAVIWGGYALLRALIRPAKR